MLGKLEQAAAIRADKGLSFDIGVDGGINTETAPRVVESGANVLVSGSTIFGAEDRAEMIAELKSSVSGSDSLE